MPPARATRVYSRLSHQGTPETSERAPTLLADRLQRLREENQRLKDEAEIRRLEEENDLLRQDPLNSTLLQGAGGTSSTSTLSVAILLTVTIKVKDLEKFLGKGVQEWQQ